MSQKQKSLKKNAFYSFIKSFMDIAFPIISFPYASRILAPEGIGKINFSNSITSYFCMIAGLGIASYATREAAKLRDNQIELNSFAREMLTLSFISTAVSYLLFLVALILIPKFQPYQLLLLLSSAGIIARGFFSVSWVFSAQEEYKYITIRSIAFQIVSLIYLFVFVRKPSDVNSYMIFGLISIVGTNLCNFFYARKFVSFGQKTPIHISRHIKPIFLFFGISFVTSIYSTLDTTMLGFLTSDEEVGLYSAATKMNHLVLGLITALTSVLLPRFSYYSERKDFSSFLVLMKKSLCINLLIALPVTAGLFMLANPLIMLLSGEKYLAAVTPMRILTPLIFIISTANITGGQILPAIGKEKISFYSYLAGTLLNILLNSLLIVRFGTAGAAIASIAAEILVVACQLVYCTHCFNFNEIGKCIFVNFMQAMFSCFFMCLSVLLVMHIIHIKLLNVVMAATIGACVYGCCLLLFKNYYICEILCDIKNKFLKTKDGRK